MQKSLETTCAYTETGPGPLTAATITCDEARIDPMILARLDIGLFRCLQNLGTSKQRICSALCLSYTEYDCVARFLQAPGESQ